MTGNVLIVDDDQSMVETLTQAMTRRGLRRDLEDLGGDALKLLDEQDLDVAVTDLHMERRNGFAFCERITANRPDLPVVRGSATTDRSRSASPASGSLLGATRIDELELVHQLFERTAWRHAGIHRSNLRAHVANRSAPGFVSHR